MVGDRLNDAVRAAKEVLRTALRWWRQQVSAGAGGVDQRGGSSLRPPSASSRDVDRILASFDLLACDQLTGMSSPALLSVAPAPQPRPALPMRDPTATLRDVIDEIRYTRKVNSHYADAVLVSVVVLAVAILIKVTIPAPRSNSRLSDMEAVLTSPVVAFTGDDGTDVESRLDFAARIEAAYPPGTFRRHEDKAPFAPVTELEIAFVPKGVPRRFLSALATGALAGAAKPKTPPAVSEGGAQTAALPEAGVDAKIEPPSRPHVRRGGLRRHAGLRRHRLPRPLPKQVVVMPPKPMPVVPAAPPLPEPGSPASLFTPASEMPPYDATDPSLSKGSLMRGVYPITPMEAEAARR